MNAQNHATKIEGASKEYYKCLNKIRKPVIAPKGGKKYKEHEPVNHKQRKSILQYVCREHDLNFDFMAKLLRVSEK